MPKQMHNFSSSLTKTEMMSHNEPKHILIDLGANIYYGFTQN